MTPEFFRERASSSSRLSSSELELVARRPPSSTPANMFRGKGDGLLPTTGKRSAAPHISTVQIPQVSTPTI